MARRSLLSMSDLDRDAIARILRTANRFTEVMGRDNKKVPTLRGDAKRNGGRMRGAGARVWCAYVPHHGPLYPSSGTSCHLLPMGEGNIALPAWRKP